MAAQLEAQYPYPYAYPYSASHTAQSEWDVKPVLHYERLHERQLYPYQSNTAPIQATSAQEDARRYSIASSQQSYTSTDIKPFSYPSHTYSPQRANINTDRRGSLPPMRPFGASPIVRRLVSYPASASYRRNSCAVPQAFHEPEQRSSICSLTSTCSVESAAGPLMSQDQTGEWQQTSPLTSTSPVAWSPAQSQPQTHATSWLRAEHIQPTINNPSKAFQSWVPPGPAPSESSAITSLPPPSSTDRRASSASLDSPSLISSPYSHTYYRREQRHETPFKIKAVIACSKSGTIPESMVTWTTDSDVKQTITTRRMCFNCQAKEPPSWRKSVLFRGRILCNKCGIFERTHKKPRPYQSDVDKLRKSTIVQSALRKPARTPAAGDTSEIAAMPSWAHKHALTGSRQQAKRLTRDELGERASFSPEVETSSHYSSVLTLTPTPTQTPAFSQPLSPYRSCSAYATPAPQNSYPPQLSIAAQRPRSRGARIAAEPYAQAYLTQRKQPSTSTDSIDISQYLPYHRSGRTMSLNTHDWNTAEQI